MFTYLTPGTNRIKYYSTKGSYSKEMGVIYINFIKALLHNRLNLNMERFNKNEEILQFLEKFQGDKLFTRHYISKLKNQGEFERVPLTPKSKEFINYVKRTFYEFDEFEFTLVIPIVAPIAAVGQSPQNKVASKETITKSKTKPIKIEPTIDANHKVEDVKIEPVKKESTVTETVTKLVEPAGKVEPIIIENIAVPTVKVEPVIIQREETIIVPTNTNTNTETIAEAENITIIPETITETITKVVVEPVVRVVEPIIETITKPVVVSDSEVQPTIVINNAINAQAINNAEAIAITSTKEASSNIDTILSIFGLRTIWNFIKEIFGFDGDGMIFLLIQLPYLVWFLLSLKDNPDIMEYLSDNFGIEEYKAPTINTELPPIEYDFFVDLDDDDSNVLDTSEENVTEDAARFYADDSSTEYFDYFDYYHSNKDDNLSNPEGIDFKDIATDISNSLLDTTKQATESIKDKINTLNDKPLESEVHIIDDQFSGLIDVYPKDNTLINKPKEMLTKATTFATGGKSTWWFPMLDFNNLNHSPSLFDIFNLSNSIDKPMVGPINSRTDYIRALINQLYKDLDLNKIDISKVENKFKSMGLEFKPKKSVTFDIDNKSISIHSDSDRWSTYFYFDSPKPKVINNQVIPMVNDQIIPMVNESTVEPLETSVLTNDGASINSSKSYRGYFKRLFQDIFTNKNNDESNSNITDSESELFSMQLPDINERPRDPLHLSVDFDTDIALQAKASMDDLFRTNQSIEDFTKQIIEMRSQFIDHHDKINKLDTEISDFTIEKNNLKKKFNNGGFADSDRALLNTIKNKLTFLENTKNQLSNDFNLNNSKINDLETKKATLVELKNKLEKELGNIAKTPV